MSVPTPVVSEEWKRVRDVLLVKEKELTRARDALAAERRRLPMVRVENDHRFEGPDAEVSLLELFEGRRQLIVYRFFLDPGMQIAEYPEQGCPDCTMFADNLPNLIHLNARDTFGRQEEWQDAPDGVPQDPTGSWVRSHDEYTPAELAGGST